MKPRYLFADKHLLSTLQASQRIALFLDYDGTLVAIRKEPKTCVLPHEIKERLRRLRDEDRCTVAVISGRSLREIRKMVGIPGIYYAGNHGLEIHGPGLRFTHPEAAGSRPLLRRINYLLAKEIEAIDGAWLEDKKFSLTLHFRSVKSKYIPLLKRMFHKTTKHYGGTKVFSVIKGKKVLELTPRAEWNKGKAVNWILKRLNYKSLPLYLGDDVTDETAFLALGNKGVTIRIGRSGKTAARYYLKIHRDVARLLKLIHEMSVRQKKQLV